MIQRTASVLLKQTIQKYNKMAFLSGPRQVGKTTLAQIYKKAFKQNHYFNWDNIKHQKKLIRDPYFFQKENHIAKQPFLLIFDEIHKYARWKNYLKGVYDEFKSEFVFLITGSGRLDFYKKGGDSLLGRYFSVPLFPFSLGELNGHLPQLSVFKRGLSDPPQALKQHKEQYVNLFHLSGFPEPYVRGEKSFYNQWFEERKTLLLREDIRDASRIREISLLETLSHLIPERVGNPLSLNALREDVGVAFETIRDWVTLLEKFFYLFRIRPYAKKIARSLKKEPKAYLYDWAEISDVGNRFENLVALHLLKAVKIWKAMGEGDVNLHYLRDKEKREVDFCLLEKGTPICLIECKHSDTEISPSLEIFQDKLNVPFAVQLVHKSGIQKKIKRKAGILWVISADSWLNLLP